jgi:hypothetical protein
MPSGLEPMPLALIVCDAIHVDPATRKPTLFGLFGTLASHVFPFAVPSMAVYVSLTECRGTLTAVLQVIDANERREAIVRQEVEVHSDDPLDIVEFDFHLTDVEFPEPGEYRVQLYVGDDHIIERRMNVIRPAGEEENDG